MCVLYGACMGEGVDRREHYLRRAYFFRHVSGFRTQQ